ncbi:MAG: hypothetical protein RJA22_768 [Verrucomicrobiota bacterium]|jgi:hypothetical protein
MRVENRPLMKSLLLVAALLGSALASPASAREALTFEKDIRPLLKAHCFHCHGETESPKGGVDLRLRRFLLRSTGHGPILVPGQPEASRMIQVIRSGEMPKGEKKMSAGELARLERWIATGARTARPEPESLPPGFTVTEEDRAFWAFQPIRRPAVPVPPAAFRRLALTNPIDAFVAGPLREQKLTFAPPAAPVDLIRRVTLDLTGLPPTPAEVDAFVTDRRPDAYERLVDRLLDAPAYGERWARHWLDVAGYADSNGFTESDSVRPHAWRYRDYVIRSLQADKPFDRFLVEQIAGDELLGLTQSNATAVATNEAAREILAATGFLRMAPDGTADNPPDQNLARNQVIAETLQVLASATLGLTVGCAQCHDHRYDPVSHEDYHRLRALLEPAYDWRNWRAPAARLVSLQGEADRRQAADIEARARQLDEEAERMRREALEQVFEREMTKIPAADSNAVRAARQTARAKRTADQQALLKKYPAADVQGALDLYDPPAHRKVQARKEEATRLRGTKPVEPFLMALTEVAGRVPETRLLQRGDHDQPRQAVAPGELSILAPPGFALARHLPPRPAGQAPLASTGRRLAYARWLTSGEHPLTARVLVNRFWLHHFGRGLVNTPGDFGALGERPSHPELLDWLASEFQQGGWRLKPLHRLIVTSRTYRQSAVHEASLRADPDNRWLARWKLRRLDAETLRDSLLAVSGKLNPQPFGPPVAVARDPAGRIVIGTQKADGNGDPVGVDSLGESEFRRSVYVQARRTRPLTVLDAFDLPFMAPNCDARAITTVAPQSLVLMNDVFVVAQSQFLAERLRREAPGDLRAQLTLAWRLLHGAAPSPAELERALVHVAEQGEAIRARAATLEAAGPGKEKDKPAPPDDSLRALASLCQVLMSANRFLYVQ